MSDTKNLLFAAVFVMGFLFVWDKFVMSRYAPATAPKPAIQKIETSAATASTPATLTASSGIKSAPAFPVEKTITLNANGQTVVIESKGARVVSWKFAELGRELEFIDPKHPRAPLETFPDLNFTIDKQTDSEAVLHVDHPQGYRLTKTISLFAEPPFHRVTLTVANLQKAPVTPNVQLGWWGGLEKRIAGKTLDKKEIGAEKHEMRVVGYAKILKSWQAGFIRNRTIDRVDPSSFDWVGVDNNHFLAAVVAEDTPITGVHIAADRDTPAAFDIPVAAKSIEPGQTVTASYLMYVGPKKYEDLKKIGHNLSHAVNFGFFGTISKFLLAALEFLHRATKNYGWAIVILTVLIQILVFPLTRKSLMHAMRMRELTPQLKKLQEMYKSDPKRLQIETFNLYKKHGMKFMGMEGCFPMLLQIPIFIALYNTLNTVYELRGAPWILWIKDLSQYDPYYVLPILMGVGMLLQQKMTAAPAADPAQAKIMMFMPIMFVFFFFKLPSGLVLYWVVNSLMTILLQRLMKMRMEPKPASA